MSRTEAALQAVVTGQTVRASALDSELELESTRKGERDQDWVGSALRTKRSKWGMANSTQP